MALEDQIAALEAQVAGLNTAIADGVRQVTIRGQTVTYNTSDSLIRARDNLRDELKALRAQQADAPVAGRIRYLYSAGRGVE